MDLAGHEYPNIPQVNAHCDSRVLHAPGECDYCDAYPEVQQWRVDNRVAFSGHPPGLNELPCPADASRPPGSQSDHRTWGGNRPTNIHPKDLPRERFGSQVMYGETYQRFYERHPEVLQQEVQEAVQQIRDGSLVVEDVEGET